MEVLSEENQIRQKRDNTVIVTAKCEHGLDLRTNVHELKRKRNKQYANVGHLRGWNSEW